jgi:hypothetical protein
MRKPAPSIVARGRGDYREAGTDRGNAARAGNALAHGHFGISALVLDGASRWSRCASTRLEKSRLAG